MARRGPVDIAVSGTDVPSSTKEALREIFQVLSDPRVNWGGEYPGMAIVEPRADAMGGLGLGYTAKKAGAIPKAVVAYDPLSKRPFAGSVAAQIENLLKMKDENIEKIKNYRPNYEKMGEIRALQVLDELEKQTGKPVSSVSKTQADILSKTPHGMIYRDVVPGSATEIKNKTIAGSIGKFGDKFLGVGGPVIDFIGVATAQKRAKDILGREPTMIETLRESVIPGITEEMSQPKY